MKFTFWGAFWCLVGGMVVADHIAYAIKGKKATDLEHQQKVADALDRIRSGEITIVSNAIGREAMRIHMANSN